MFVWKQHKNGDWHGYFNEEDHVSEYGVAVYRSVGGVCVLSSYTNLLASVKSFEEGKKLADSHFDAIKAAYDEYIRKSTVSFPD